MTRKLNNQNIWSLFSLLTISKVAIIGFAILTSIALIALNL